jgi:hypothetical protein
MKVYQKLNAARKQFHTLQLKKTGLNKFAGYSYFELGDFLIPALNVFEEVGLCAFISFGKDVATMNIVCTEDGSSVALTSPMAEAQLKGCHPIQNLGAVETYTRRYLWVAALEIVEHDALDSSAPIETKTDGKTVRAVYKETVKQPALGGIGDELDAKEKARLKQLAAWVSDNIDFPDVVQEELEVQQLDETQSLYMQSFLGPKERKALGMTYVKAA